MIYIILEQFTDKYFIPRILIRICSWKRPFNACIPQKHILARWSTIHSLLRYFLILEINIWTSRLIPCFGYHLQTLDDAFNREADENTKDALTRVVVTQVDTNIQKIKEDYHNKYGVHISDKIDEEVNGNYKDFLLTLLSRENWSHITDSVCLEFTIFEFLLLDILCLYEYRVFCTIFMLENKYI